jgi:hypothetical protein
LTALLCQEGGAAQLAEQVLSLQAFLLVLDLEFFDVMSLCHHVTALDGYYLAGRVSCPKAAKGISKTVKGWGDVESIRFDLRPDNDLSRLPFSKQYHHPGSSGFLRYTDVIKQYYPSLIR